jgi:hypothetical protein
LNTGPQAGDRCYKPGKQCCAGNPKAFPRSKGLWLNVERVASKQFLRSGKTIVGFPEFPYPDIRRSGAIARKSKQEAASENTSVHPGSNRTYG